MCFKATVKVNHSEGFLKAYSPGSQPEETLHCELGCDPLTTSSARLRSSPFCFTLPSTDLGDGHKAQHGDTRTVKQRDGGFHLLHVRLAGTRIAVFKH